MARCVPYNIFLHRNVRILYAWSWQPFLPFLQTLQCQQYSSHNESMTIKDPTQALVKLFLIPLWFQLQIHYKWKKVLCPPYIKIKGYSLVSVWQEHKIKNHFCNIFVNIVSETSMNIILQNIQNLYSMPRIFVFEFKKGRSCICGRKSTNDNDDSFIPYYDRKISFEV